MENWYQLCFIKDYDEDDLEAELDALGEELEIEQQKDLDEKLLEVGPAVPSNLPEVRNNKIIHFPHFCIFKCSFKYLDSQ